MKDERYPAAAISALPRSRAKLIRQLQRKRYRRQFGAFLVEGERVIDELATSPVSIGFLFGTGERAERLAALFPGEEVFAVDEAEAADLFATEHAQGVGAVVDIPDSVSLGDLLRPEEPLLYLDRLADPGNVGTILRTAEWFSCAGLLLGPGTADLYNPKTVRSTMGAVFRMPVAEDVTESDLVATGRPLFALDAGGTDIVGESDLPRNGIYIIGNEAHGVSPGLLASARTLSIGGGEKGGESLNAAAAAAIICHVLWRGRPTP